MLREDLPGFVFESNRGTKHSFTAETTMGPEFAAGWTGHRHKKFRSKMEETRQKVCVCSAVVEIGRNFALEIRENLAEVSCYRYNNGLIGKQCLMVFLFFRFRC